MEQLQFAKLQHLSKSKIEWILHFPKKIIFSCRNFLHGRINNDELDLLIFSECDKNGDVSISGYFINVLCRSMIMDLNRRFILT